MPSTSTLINGHRRASSSSTVRGSAAAAAAAAASKNASIVAETIGSKLLVKAGFWIHDDGFSQEEILINPSILAGSVITEGSLVEVAPYEESTEVLDFSDDGPIINNDTNQHDSKQKDTTTHKMTCLCIVKFAPTELLTKHQGLEISMTKTIAETFHLQPRTQVALKPTTFDQWTASHIELSFRDAYLARSDMWRLVSNELVNKIIYKGQKISFLGTMKLTVRDVRVKGVRASTGFFGATTIPVFRSEAARYVLFIQMSREMWDFDSEGNGEIMFNRVINGFLPDLFRRWVQLEVRHLVSIVLFGRLEYDRYDLGDTNAIAGADRISLSSSTSRTTSAPYQDFFRVVVTDMASAQWTTILNELKKDFRVFLRDMSLYTPLSDPSRQSSAATTTPKITGRPSTALKGNILEAINLASSQFANDYIDRDLIRTGVSTMVITAGTGVFDVDRDLLNLTSENLTNNGIGIDIVCLSNMPLHSVPLFRYRIPQSAALSRVESNISNDLRDLASSVPHPSLLSADRSSVLSSYTGTSAHYFSRFPGAFPSKIPQPYGYGIPHWIDLSYWSDSTDGSIKTSREKHSSSIGYQAPGGGTPFIPRVRMYELQMMGLMELGMADISIPYIAETPMKSKRPRRQTSADLGQFSMKNLSHSPSYFRKASAFATRQKEGVGITSQRNASSDTSFLQFDEYDDLLFLDVNQSGVPSRSKQKRKKQKSKQKQPTKTEQVQNHSTSIKQNLADVSERDFSPQARPSTPSRPSSATDKPGTPHKTNLNPKPPRISRSISYALRGLSAPIRYTLNTENKVENVKALPAAATTSLTQVNATAPSVLRAESIRGSEARDVDTRSTMSSESTSEHATRPISITGSSYKAVSQQVSHKLDMPLRVKAPANGEPDKHRKLWPTSHSDTSSGEDVEAGGGANDKFGSVPKNTLPFVRNVNASNPLKRKSGAESLFGRWQHLYPRRPHASTVKWRSLCTPASVPLTTEDFPTGRQLEEEYDIREHRVQVRRTNDATEGTMTLDSLLMEMIVLRLSHGYQIVIGDAVRKVIGNTLCEISVFLDPANLSKYGNNLMMCMGNTIQKLSFGHSENIHVTKYVKKEIEVQQPFRTTYAYNPNIRTILSPDYWPRSMELRGFSEEYPWETADNYLADGEIDSSSKVNKLRFWRARFVLLPVEPPSNTWRSQQTSDDNEEEIHLLGLRALTQMWQKARYFSPNERKTGPDRLGNNRKRDQNPLEIKFETLDPSELVATELDKLLALEETGEVASTQLLTDSEKLDGNTSMAKLAQAMQGEKGIEIKNRRWHLRLYYNCFHGEEFTNWLLHNVRTVETREEAVEFGNQLMQEGLFEHVNGRHRFKDGNYFYSLKQEFKAPRIDPKSSWFSGARRTDKSVPPTPISEHPTKEGLTISTRSRSGSSLAFSFNPSTPSETSRAFLDRRKKTVTLTKMIKIDVDVRKRSKRSEIVNLHYDRFHNPENCYHMELSWLNTTSKLVDDAIVSWTTQAERYGLKLVEVPIAEASKIPDSEPFRRSYQIKLALEPPKRQAVSHVLTSNSFTPQPCPSPERHSYQKAILKRFNFVLDLEGSSEFPDNVDIQYSSAGLEYQYTQFVHRSGVLLAQITDEGDFILLANRLYNARFANSKEASNASKFDTKKEPTLLGPGFPQRTTGTSTTHASSSVITNHNLNLSASLQPSSLITTTTGNLPIHSPRLSTTPTPSPLTRATADVLGLRAAVSHSSIGGTQWVTPEHIKDDLEAFCHDEDRLAMFYREVAALAASSSTNAARRSAATTMVAAGGMTSPSGLQPIQDANEGVIPEFVLPESVTAGAAAGAGAGGGVSGSGNGGSSSSTHPFGMGMGMGMVMGFSGSLARRSRASVAYEGVSEMFGRTGTGAGAAAGPGGNGSGSGDRNDGSRDRTGMTESGGSRVPSGGEGSSGRTSGGDVSGSLELKVRVDAPSAHRIVEGIEEGLNDHMGSPKA